jgi:hypothetical protein
MTNARRIPIPSEGAGGFPSDFLERALRTFERNGLWLLLSIVHYGWRAHADMAYLLVHHRPTEAAPDEEWHLFQHQALAALEEVFLVVDQLYRLIRATRSHVDGRDFLEAYTRQVSSLHTAYAELAKLSAEEWADLLPLPESGALVKCLGEMGVPGDLAAEMLELSESLHGLFVTNMQEITVFFERAPSPIPGKTNYSLRDTNNKVRHGTCILYRDCDPVELPDIPTNPVEKAAMLLKLEEIGPDAWEETVDILVDPPSATGGAHTIKSRYSAQWCESLVQVAADLGIMVLRLAVGFLRTQVDGQPSCAALAPVVWTPLDAHDAKGGLQG